MTRMPSELPLIDDYEHIFLQDVPLIDVRAPVEFVQGAFPAARNLPLMSDEERERIGVQYAQEGQDSAIHLGHQLVSGDTKLERVQRWSEFVEQNPEGALYCFRGGLRSRICQQWIFEQTGISYPRVYGGYKALRRFLLEKLETNLADVNVLVLGGRTGTGKTLLLQKLRNMIDLEGIYHHRGSAFGKHVTAQPAQIDIENRLSINLMKLRQTGCTTIIFEDEGRNIGSRNLPQPVRDALSGSPLILLQADMTERVDNVFDEYITAALNEYREYHGMEAGFAIWAQNLVDTLAKIRRRLGGQRYQVILGMMEEAVEQHRDAGQPGLHKIWIRELLENYYDPMYDYQLQKKTDRVVFTGNTEEVLEWLANRPEAQSYST